MPPRKSQPMNKFLSGALEQRQTELLAMLDDVLKKQVVEETVVVECPRCKAAAGGKNMKSITATVSVVKYRVSDAVRVLKLMAEYGVSRPPEEKHIELDLNKKVREFASMTDEELAAWASSES